MDALQKVLNTILDVLNIIKEFFVKLFPQAGEGEGDAAGTPEA